MEKEYEVEVVFRQRAIYRVSALDGEAAERLAVERWQAGAPSEVPGYAWAELDRVRAKEAADAEQLGQDAELVLRFLQERERLILRTGGDVFNPSTNDAISADQVAADLGWTRTGIAGSPVTDGPRATQALERLCRQHRVVCFERPRVRAGERGEIRLYCTPEYLERLSESLTGLEREAV